MLFRSDALSYNFYTKELKINPGLFLTEVTGKSDLDYYDLDLKFRQDLNDRFIQGIFHELIHSFQNKIVNNPNDYDETIVRVIQNGIEQCLYNYSIYLKHYDHMIIEYNAASTLRAYFGRPDLGTNMWSPSDQYVYLDEPVNI